MMTMSNDRSVRESWQAQDAQAQPPTMAEVRKAAGKFFRRIRLRNAVEYVACIIVVISFSYYVFALEQMLQRIGSAMVVVGTLVAAWQLHRRASAIDPENAGTMPIMDFVRAQLVRQRDALASIFWWYLLPFVPGLVVMTAGSLALRLEEGQGGAIRGIIGISVMLAIFVGIWLLNLWGARKLQKHIDDIDALTGEAES
jgi:hypothetical protein